MPKKPTPSKPSRAKQGRGEGLNTHALLALLGATAYDLWMSALTSTSPRGMELYQRMKNPEIGDQVMEMTTYRRITKNRRGFGKLIEKTGNNHELETTWTIETPDGQTCDWRNASMIAIPAGSFEWYPSLANVEAWHPLPGAPLRFRLRFFAPSNFDRGRVAGCPVPSCVCVACTETKKG